LLPARLLSYQSKKNWVLFFERSGGRVVSNGARYQNWDPGGENTVTDPLILTGIYALSCIRQLVDCALVCYLSFRLGDTRLTCRLQFGSSCMAIQTSFPFWMLPHY